MSIEEMSMTRGVVVSDGVATDWTEIDIDQALESTKGKILQIYKEQGIPLDCVHISSSQEGEDLLRRIASETGGIFLKFSDVNAFSKAFGYLTPGYRAMLTSGSVDAKQIGAKEIK
jgi:Mg-chelatase subunit ChlD